MCVDATGSSLVVIDHPPGFSTRTVYRLYLDENPLALRPWLTAEWSGGTRATKAFTSNDGRWLVSNNEKGPTFGSKMYYFDRLYDLTANNHKPAAIELGDLAPSLDEQMAAKRESHRLDRFSSDGRYLVSTVPGSSFLFDLHQSKKLSQKPRAVEGDVGEL
jgi:hypothetical protein